MSKLIAHNRAVAPGSNKVRNSFHRINGQEEFEAAVVNWGHYPCVIHMGHDLAFKQPKTGMPRRVTQNALRFLAKANKSMYKLEADAIEAAYDFAAQAMFQFVAYMIKDYEEKSDCCSELFIFDLNRAQAEQTGMVHDGVYGWDLFFDDENKENGFIYNANDWYDGDPDSGNSGDNCTGGIVVPVANSEIIPFAEDETVKIIALTEDRKSRFGTSPKVQYWYFEQGVPKENTNLSITADALPPNISNLYVDLNAPGPGVIILSK